MSAVTQMVLAAEAGSSGVWTTEYTLTPITANDNIGSATTIVQLIPASQFSANGSQFRLTLVAGTTGTAVVTEMWAGSAAGSGNVYDFDGTQVQVKSGGNAAFNISANGTLVTDANAYSFDKTKNFLVAWYYSTTSNIGMWGGSTGSAPPVGSLGCARYYTAGNTASTTTKAGGYSSNASYVDFVTTLEVLVP